GRMVIGAVGPAHGAIRGRLCRELPGFLRAGQPRRARVFLDFVPRSGNCGHRGVRRCRGSCCRRGGRFYPATGLGTGRAADFGIAVLASYLSNTSPKRKQGATGGSFSMISAVIPVYNERESLELLHAEIVETAEQQKLDLEAIFVDDGSTDGSWTAI